jgi:hypothetical protein
MSTTSSQPSENVAAASPTPAADTSRFRASANPHARQAAQRLAALMATVKEQDVADVARILLDMARDGNIPAAKLLFSYVIGKPAPAVSPDRLDIDEWRIFKETAPMAAEMPALAEAPLSSFPRDIVRMMRPASTTTLAKQMHQYAHQPATADKDAQAAPPPNGHNGKKRRTPPSPNGVSNLDPEAWFVDLNIAGPSPNRSPAPPDSAR